MVGGPPYVTSTLKEEKGDQYLEDMRFVFFFLEQGVKTLKQYYGRHM